MPGGARYGADVEPTLIDRYLDLVVESVNGSLYARPYLAPVPDLGRAPRRFVGRFLAKRGGALGRLLEVPDAAFELGEDWDGSRIYPAHSMIGRARLTNVRESVETIVREDIPGDLIETGVWRGGATIVMRAVLAARGDTNRIVHVADSFEGLPPADETDDAARLHRDSTLAVSQEEVAEAFRRFGLLDDQVRFVKGWFSDSLPGLRGTPWSLIRLDGDMYDSTRDALVSLYPDLSPGGFLIVDDYGTYESCRRAVDEYRTEHGIAEEIVTIDRHGVYWRKRS